MCHNVDGFIGTCQQTAARSYIIKCNMKAVALLNAALPHWRREAAYIMVVYRGV